jgi:hypothetical protein
LLKQRSRKPSPRIQVTPNFAISNLQNLPTLTSKFAIS